MERQQHNHASGLQVAGGVPRWGPVSCALDRFINALKWPVAVVSILILPWALMASLRLAARIWTQPTPVLAFILGLVAYSAAWHLLFRHRLFGTFFSTLEHELTHAIFALATFHPIEQLRSTFTRGGHVKYWLYKSSGNWLITISPYFVPTLSFALILVLVHKLPIIFLSKVKLFEFKFYIHIKSQTKIL